ncbi:MAG TPA: SRPBCC family protein [Deinococcales bacterium]|nr:SRPBCC family protein [Deinococcales bacterium]
MVETAGRKATVTLPSDTQILIMREFDAPRRLVYRAFTTPELIKRWWGGRRGTVTLVELDLRVGGRWRYVLTTPQGFEAGFHGECLELVPEERQVFTEVFEGYPGEAARNTATWTDLGDRTLFTVLVEHSNQMARDAHLNSGMEGGMQEAYDLLEELAVSGA